MIATQAKISPPPRVERTAFRVTGLNAGESARTRRPMTAQLSAEPAAHGAPQPGSERRPTDRLRRGSAEDAERRRDYVGPVRPPPITRRKSLMEEKRITGLCRFSSPIVVELPP